MSYKTYLPFTPIPPERDRPDLPQLARYWIYTFYNPSDSDSILFLRIYLITLASNIAIAAVYILSAIEPGMFGWSQSLSQSEIAKVFLHVYPAKVVPLLTASVAAITILMFAVQSSAFSVSRIKALKHGAVATYADELYARQPVGLLIIQVAFIGICLSQMESIPNYFAGYKLYSGVVDADADPLRTMITFMITYFALFQLLIVSCISFCIVAIIRSVFAFFIR